MPGIVRVRAELPPVSREHTLVTIFNTVQGYERLLDEVEYYLKFYNAGF